MRSDHPAAVPYDRLSRAILMARRLVESHDASRAARVLDLLLKQELNSQTRLQLEMLRIQSWIDQGLLREAGGELERLRDRPIAAELRDELELLDAHRQARMSRYRVAMRSAFDVIRRCGRSGDRAAKAYWIAGVALYRFAH